MTPHFRTQRGEGKVGCLLSLIIFGSAAAAALKLVPVYFSNNEMVRAAEEIAGRAATLPQATIEAQIRAKAGELQIPEVVAPGALAVTKSGGGSGVCTVRLNYTRKVDLYGVFTFDVKTETTKAVPFADYR